MVTKRNLGMGVLIKDADFESMSSIEEVRAEIERAKEEGRIIELKEGGLHDNRKAKRTQTKDTP